MDLAYPEETESFRQSVRQFLSRELPTDWAGLGALDAAGQEIFRQQWRKTLVDNCMIGATWPQEYGGAGLTLVEHSIMLEEFVRAGVPALPLPNDVLGLNLLGTTLLHWGTEEQKKRFLGPTISGEIRWAQGYSEPDAGSDLFNARTRGVVSGDKLILNGQKTWQTAGISSNWLFCLVRTDQDARPSRRLSFILVPCDQKGVEIRAIRTMAGTTELSEVFFTDAETSLNNVVGGLGNGAKVALTLLGYERGAGGVASALAFKIELQRLVELAKFHGRDRDTEIRRRLARCHAQVHGLHCLALRALTQRINGVVPGPESSTVKTVTAEYHQTVTELAMDILGASALTPAGPGSVEALQAQPLGLDANSSRAWVDDYLNARAGTIYGGSSQIQRNTIGERILGLPREPRPSPSMASPAPI